MNFNPLPEYDDFSAEIKPLCHDEYYKFVYQFDAAHYLERVDMAGFVGARRVLDAGCGYGQWATALSRRNDHVVGIDVNANMVEISRRFARREGVKNVEFHHMGLPKLGFADAEFDLIWCWGVVMFLDFAGVMQEFHRLLKPGGRVLIGCCNAQGRWLQKALHALHPRAFNWAAFKNCCNAIYTGHRRHAIPNYTTFRGAKKRCNDEGLELLAVDYDGHLDLAQRGRRRPMFTPRVLGLAQNIEFIATKPAAVAGGAGMVALRKSA